MKGDMYIARASDKKIVEKAEGGGVVTSLFKFALESGRVDAVLAIKARDGNRYDGIPVLITDAKEIAETAGALHCTSPNIARFLKEYLSGASDQKIAVVAKPCDAKAIIELTKRSQINLDNLHLIGLNCTGTLPSVKAKDMLRYEFGVNPTDVVAEDIEDNKLTVTLKDGTRKEKDLTELEQKGYGRRDNCRRCETNIPGMSDVACGKWGATDNNTTFVEVCSQKGSDLIEAAIEAGYIEVEKPSDRAIETRAKKDKAATEQAQQWQKTDFAGLREMSTVEKFNYWSGQFSHCTKCYGCRDACPICYCKSCFLEAHRGFVTSGEVPPNVMFPMVRIIHVMDSCVNCGQCQDVCPMELPLSRLIFSLNRELTGIFSYEPGMEVTELPPLRTVTDQGLDISGVEVTF